MKSTHAVATLTSLFFIMAIPLAACSSDNNRGTPANGTDSGVSSDPATATFITQYCAAVATCCGNVALPSDPSLCTSMLTGKGGTFDAAGAQTCLDDIKQSASDPQWCTSYATPPRCSDVLAKLVGEKGNGTVKIGDPCTQSSDCALQNPASWVVCHFSPTTNENACTEVDAIDETSATPPPCKGDVTFDAVGWLEETAIGGTQSNVCETNFLARCQAGTGKCDDPTGGGQLVAPGGNCDMSHACEIGFCGDDGTPGTCASHFAADQGLQALCGSVKP
jgi:hypothetical protein